MLKMFTIDSKRTIIRGAAAFCAASFLTACAPAGAIETPPQATSLPTVEMPLASEEATPFETGTAAPSEAGTTAPAGEFLEETVGLSELIEESSIQIKSFDGEIGDYSFFACKLIVCCYLPKVMQRAVRRILPYEKSRKLSSG